jgi:GlpG protein
VNIVTFSEKRVALAFSDYLRSQDMPNRIEAGPQGFSIVLSRPEQAERALEEAKAFAAHPDDPKYWQASWRSGRVQAEPVYDRAATVPGFSAWWVRGGWTTRAVTLLCVLVFLALNIEPDAAFGLLSYPHAISVVAINGEWWRLLTPALMHFGVLHIAFNLLWWWELGGLVERMQSGARLLALTLVIALVSNAVQFLSYGPDFGGLSAVVYGLLGYLWLYPLADPNAPFRIRPAIVLFMLGWLALGYTGIFDKLFGQISNNGHLSGLLAGAGLGLLLGLVNYRRHDAEEE